MCNTAAHLVDRIVPAVAVRQWVLSLPFELRGLAAFDAKVLAALSRFFADALATRYRACARRDGVVGAQGGAVTFVHRRAVAWLERHGHVGDGDTHRERGPLEACAAAALQRGTVRKLADDDGDADTDEPARPEQTRTSRDAVDVEGFNLEASVRIDANDDLGRERLFRY
jgi:hypothetical protein